MKVKVISALEKCFLDQQIWEKKAVIGGSMLKNERYSFQVCYQMDQTKELCNGVRYAVMEVSARSEIGSRCERCNQFRLSCHCIQSSGIMPFFVRSRGCIRMR